MHYLLDLETLLIFLSRQYQSGELSADLKRFPGLASKKGYRVRILLMQGKMASCTVRNEEGKLLIEGEAALKALLKIGQLGWSWSADRSATRFLQPSQLPGSINGLVPDRMQLVPRRLVAVNMIDRATLPRKGWQVLIVIDGSRTVAQIAALLLRSASAADIQELFAVLNDLERRGIIVLMGT